MQAKANFSWKRFETLPVIGILRGLTGKQILQTAEVYQKVGFSTLEVTMNTQGAAEIISQLSTSFPNLNIGAGTVCDMEDLDTAKNAGASFIVTPILDIELIKACRDSGLPVFPGAYTPTEVFQAWRAGASAVKVFPASQLGPRFIKDLLAPLNKIRLVPTGGVSKSNIKAYFEAGVTGVGMGSSLFPRSMVEGENLKKLEDHLRSVKDEVQLSF